jgi:hypothetical protein
MEVYHGATRLPEIEARLLEDDIKPLGDSLGLNKSRACTTVS